MDPTRDITVLAQRFVIFGPVGHFVMRFFDLVMAALTVFVQHRLFRRRSYYGSCQITRPPAGRSIYSTYIDALSLPRLHSSAGRVRTRLQR